MRIKRIDKNIKAVILCVFLAFLAIFVSACTADIENAESTSPEIEVAEENPYRTDREILDDYKSIEVFGEHDVRILFINAGRADSILIEADGKYYVIDTGKETSVPKIVAAIEYMGVTQIDGVFLTHSNNDHISGLPYLSNLYDIKACYTAPLATEMTKIQGVIERASLEQTILEPGSVIEISDGFYFEVLGPITYNPIDENDNSLVLRMRVNGKTILFAGDMQYDEEKTLMHAGFDLRCDILKVGNHGNRDATSVSFIEESSPAYAIITTDREIDSGSAHKSVRHGLEDIGAEVMITDDYDLGILCEISHKGKITFENAKWKSEHDKIEFVSVSKEDQTVVIKNTGKSDADLSRWFIVSDRGGELFMFPDGAILKSGEEMTIACNDYRGDADYKWGETKVWHKTKDDNATLIDNHGNVIDKMPSK